MSKTKAAIVASVAIVAGLAVAIPATAQEGDLDCGDPGTSHNMPVEIGNDPHGLDDDQDGIGCEDPSAFDGGTEAPPADTGGSAEPAEPVEEEPDFTG
jgi:hypothetical protein